MTVKECYDRLSFDTDLIDMYIPNNLFKLIYPLKKGSNSLTESGWNLEKVYEKIEKSS